MHKRDLSVALVWAESVKSGTAAGRHLEGTMQRLSHVGFPRESLHEVSSEGHSPVRRILSVALRAALRAFHDDILIMRWHPIFPAIALPWIAMGKRRVVLLQGVPTDMYPSHPAAARLRKLIDPLNVAGLRLANSVATPTPEITALVRDLLGGARQYVTLPNGASRYPDVEQLSRPINGRYVVFGGHLSRWQGITVLLDALEDPEWPRDVALVVIGDGPERSRVEECHDPRLIYLGRQPGPVLQAYLRGALASLCPKVPDEATAHGLSPLKLMEAGVLGTPAIATRLPGQVEHVEAYGCGLLVNPNSADEISAAVALIAGDPELECRIRRGAEHCGEESHWVSRAPLLESAVLGL